MNDQTEAEPPRPRRLPLSRQRLVELTVVVFGVLIALSLESLVQEMRWNAEARDLERLFESDMGNNFALAMERIAVDSCLGQRLVALSDTVSPAVGPTAAQRLAPIQRATAMQYVLPEAYRVNPRVWQTLSFERALGSEATKRITTERFSAYAAQFNIASGLSSRADTEQVVSAELAALAYAQPSLDPEVRADVLKTLTQLDRLRARMLIGSTQLIQSAGSFEQSRGRLHADLKQSRQVANIMLRGRQDFGACFDPDAAWRVVDQALLAKE